MSKQEDITDLLARIDYLEKVNAECMQALEMFASMGEIHGDISGSRSLESIFELAFHYLERVTELEASGFFIVDEETGLFELSACQPPGAVASELESIVSKLVESGEFAWAINQNRPVELDAGVDKKALLHVLATRSRIRGMFVAIMPSSTALPGGFMQHMISIIIHHISYAVESSSLYSMISEQRDSLSGQTRELNLSNARLVKEIERRSFIENTLRENEKKLRLSQKIANIATWEWDVEKGNMFWSERAAEIFGYPGSVSETNSDRFYRNILEEDRDHVRAALNDAIRKRGECNTEFRIRMSSGKIRWLHIVGEMQGDDINIGTMFGVVEDITNRKNTQLDLLMNDHHDAPAGESELGPCSVVYIDDDEGNIALMEKIVRRWPQLSLSTSTSAEAGIELIRESQPDVVILDIIMPGVDGFECLQRLQAMEETSAIPVMALSADASSSSIQQGMKDGFRYYLTKPVDVAVLFSALVELTKERAMEHASR